MSTDQETLIEDVIQPLEKRLGFEKSFGVVTRSTRIAVYIVDRERISPQSERFGVYISHGVAAGRFWRNSPPLITRATLEQARKVASSIFGISNSGRFAEVHVY